MERQINVATNDESLAESQQTLRQMTRSLLNLSKCHGKWRQTCSTWANAKAKQMLNAQLEQMSKQNRC